MRRGSAAVAEQDLNGRPGLKGWGVGGGGVECEGETERARRGCPKTEPIAKLRTAQTRYQQHGQWSCLKRLIVKDRRLDGLPLDKAYTKIG